MSADLLLAMQLQGLALVTLQLQIEHGEADAALHRLVSGVADLCKARVLLCRRGADGLLQGLACSDSAGLPPPGSGEARLLSRALDAHGALSYGGWLAMPVQRYGQTHGVLALATGGAVDLGALAGQIDPVVSTLASLLATGSAGVIAGGIASGNPTGITSGLDPAPVAQAVVPAGLLRSALRESGTYVWEWDLPSDALADIDEGALMLGYAPHELGRTQDDWNRIIHPDDLAPIEQSFEAHRRGEREVFDHVYRARARDGTWRWVQERGRIVEWCADGSPRRMVGTQIDVSERIGLQVQARDHVQRLRRIARQLPGVLFQYRQVPGRRGQFEYVSERAQQLLGVEPATLMRDALALLGRVDGDDLAELRAQAQRCAEDGQPLRGEVRLRRSDARLVVLRCTAQGQALQGGGAMWHGHLDDVSGERDSEQQQLRARAQQSSDRARSGFLARMSHELRTPLNAVLGFAQLLRSDVVDPPTASQAARLARIQDAGEHLLGMIGDLLDLTHLETGRLTVLHEPVQLDGVVRQCVELMRPLAERAGLSLQFDAGESLLVCGDRLRLQQIVVNLLSNAIKYNRPLGWVRMTCGTVEAGLARLDVVDSGLGLAPEQLAHLFEPFNRLGRDHSGIDGTGIGLALSRNLADMMQARIEVRSEPGRGSTFSLVMPLHQAVDLPS